MPGTATHGFVDLQRRIQLFLNGSGMGFLDPQAGIGVKYLGRWLEFRAGPSDRVRIRGFPQFSVSKVGGTGCSISEEFRQYSV